jgi:hypothetical protein
MTDKTKIFDLGGIEIFTRKKTLLWRSLTFKPIATFHVQGYGSGWSAM